MSVLDVGPIPEYIHLHLTRGSDLPGTITGTVAGVPTNWPAGTSLALVFPDSGVSWPAAVSGATATWAVDKELADARTNDETVQLVYTNGTTDLVIWNGKVARHD